MVSVKKGEVHKQLFSCCTCNAFWMQLMHVAKLDITKNITKY